MALCSASAILANIKTRPSNRLKGNDMDYVLMVVEQYNGQVIKNLALSHDPALHTIGTRAEVEHAATELLKEDPNLNLEIVTFKNFVEN